MTVSPLSAPFLPARPSLLTPLAAHGCIFRRLQGRGFGGSFTDWLQNCVSARMFALGFIPAEFGLPRTWDAGCIQTRKGEVEREQSQTAGKQLSPAGFKRAT